MLKVKTGQHAPILLKPITDALIEPVRRLDRSAPAHAIVDCTLGGGGHTEALLEAMASLENRSSHFVLSIDRDIDAVERAKERFRNEIAAGRLKVLHANFSQITDVEAGVPLIGLLADLGFSSIQMDDPERGLSFRSEGPLDMRLDRSQGETCREYLLRVRENELADIIYEFGEERFSRRIARAIVDARSRREFPDTPKALADLIVKALPPPARNQRIHAATRTFQALRIAVNQELEELDLLLDNGSKRIVSGGRMAIMSFHSLEDRKAKVFFRDAKDEWVSVFKKPLVADEAEQNENPRSRSAKLRVHERK